MKTKIILAVLVAGLLQFGNQTFAQGRHDDHNRGNGGNSKNYDKPHNDSRPNRNEPSRDDHRNNWNDNHNNWNDNRRNDHRDDHHDFRGDDDHNFNWGRDWHRVPPPVKIFTPRPKIIIENHHWWHPVPHLPFGYSTLWFGGRNYFYHGGCFYNYYNNLYSMVFPPFGIRIGILPFGYRQIYFGNLSYYYYNGIYYQPIEDEYEVVVPQIGTIVPELPKEGVEEVVVDGKNYLKYDKILYKPVVTKDGVQYQVVGKLDDDN